MPPQGQGAAAAAAALRAEKAKKAKKKRLANAVKEFERQHGPLAMRTADTPKQEKMRPKRRKKRIAEAAEKYASQRGPLAMRTADTPWQTKHRHQRAIDRVYNQDRDYGPTSVGSKYARPMGPTAGWNHITPALSKAYGEQRRAGLHADVGASGDIKVDTTKTGSADAFEQAYHDKTGKWLEEPDRRFLTNNLHNTILHGVTEDIPGFIAKAFPGAGDVRGHVRMGADPVNVLPGLPEAKTPLGKAFKANTEASLAGFVGAVGMTPQQWVDDAVGIPGFFYMLATDPIGTLQAQGDAMVAMAKDPMNNIGHLTLMLGMAMGGGVGAIRKAPIVARALRAGDILEAAKVIAGDPLRRGKYGTPSDVRVTLPSGVRAYKSKGIPLLRRLADSMPGREGRARARNRQFAADLMASVDMALLRRGKELDDAEGMAGWMVNSQRMPWEVILTLEEHLANANTRGARIRLQNRLDIAHEIAQRNLVVKADSGRVVVNPQFKDLVEVHDLAARRSAAMGEKKAKMAEVDPDYGVAEEVQRKREVSQWAAFGGAGEFFTPARARRAARELEGALRSAEKDARNALRSLKAAGKATAEEIAAVRRKGAALRLSTRSVKAIARIEPYIQEARALRTQIESELGKLEALHAEIESARFPLEEGHGDLVRAYEAQRQVVARMSRDYARNAKYFEQFQTALADHFKAGEELGMTAQQLRDFTHAREIGMREARNQLEASQMLVESLETAVGERLQWRGFRHHDPYAEPPPQEWLTYTSGRSKRGVVEVHAPNAGRDVVGKTKPWSRKPFKGHSVSQGTFETNAVQAIARENLRYAQLLERYELWQTLVREGLTASEMLQQLERGEMSIRHLRAVRIKGGNNLPETNALLEEIFGKGTGKKRDALFSPNLFNSHNFREGLVMQLLEEVAGNRKIEPESIRAAKAEIEAKLAEYNNPKLTKDMQDLAVAVADVTDISEQVRFFDNRKYKVQTHVLGRQGRGRQLWNATNSVFKMSVLAGHLTGWAFPQIVGMVVMQLLEEGFKGPVDMMAKAPHVWRQASFELKEVMRTTRGLGYGRAMEASGEVNPLRAMNNVVADAFGIVMDSPFRTSSFIHFADLLGYKVKIKGFDKAGPIYDVSRLEELARKALEDQNSPEFDDLMTIEHLIGEEYGRFSRLGPTEKGFADAIFFYPWLRASAVYAAKFPLNHPIWTGYLALGGKVSNDRTEDILIEAIIRAVHASPEEAKKIADKFMQEYPGIFPTGPSDAQGNVNMVNPASSAFLQMPFDILKAVKGLWSDEPTAELLRMGAPVIAILGQTLPGGYNTRFGEPESGDLSMWERLGKQAKGYVPFLTMLSRLGIFGEQSDSATFHYTPGEAYGQMFGGSIGKKGLITKNMVEQMRRDDQEAQKGGARAGRGIDRQGNVTKAAKDVEWLRDHPEFSDPELLSYAINYRKMVDAYNKGYEALQGDEGTKHKVYTIDQYLLKMAVIKDLRPGVITDADIRRLSREMDSGDDDRASEARSEIDEYWYYSDQLGVQILTELSNAREAAKDA